MLLLLLLLLLFLLLLWLQENRISFCSLLSRATLVNGRSAKVYIRLYNTFLYQQVYLSRDM